MSSHPCSHHGKWVGALRHCKHRFSKCALNGRDSLEPWTSGLTCSAGDLSLATSNFGRGHGDFRADVPGALATNHRLGAISASSGNNQDSTLTFPYQGRSHHSLDCQPYCPLLTPTMEDMEPHVSGFFRLPINIRQRIYEDVMALKGQVLVVGYGMAGPEKARLCNAMYSMLLTCREIYQEVSSIFFERSIILVGNDNLEDNLAWIKSFSPHACSRLKRLTVHLHLEGRMNMPGSKLSAKPLSSALIEAWEIAMRHVLTHTKPGRLELELVCDSAKSPKTAAAVLEPFFDFPAILKSFEIRLSHERNDQALSSLATSAATFAMKGNMYERPFRFLDLPTKVRRRVLEYTNLVTPHRQLCWNLTSSFYVVNNWENHFRRESTGRKEDFDGYLPCYDPSVHDVTGRTCLRECSGYSARCKCWTSPKSLLLVCRTMYQDALSVLYSENAISVVPDRKFMIHVASLGLESLRARLDASALLISIPTTMLCHLQTLEIAFPPFRPEFNPAPSSWIIRDWYSAIRHLDANIAAPKLTVIVHIATASAYERGPCPGFDALCRRKFFEKVKKGNQISLSAFATYDTFLRPLRKLRCMKRLFVHAEYLWHSSLEPSYRSLETCKEVLALETAIEKQVMGEKYDSWSHGKRERKASEWLIDVWENQIDK